MSSKSSFIIEVSVGGHSRGEAVVGAIGPIIGVDGAGRIDFHPTPATATAVFAERQGVLYAMSANEKQPAWIDRARLPAVWTPVTSSTRLQVGLAMVAVRSAAMRPLARRDEEPTLISVPARVPVSGSTRVHAVTSPHGAQLDDSGSNPAMVWSRSGSTPPAMMPLATPAPMPVPYPHGQVYASAGGAGAGGASAAKPARRWVRIVGLSVAGVLAVLVIARARGANAEHAHAPAAAGGEETAAAVPVATPASPSAPVAAVTASTNAGGGAREAAVAAPVTGPVIAPMVLAPGGKVDKKAAAAAAAQLTPEAMAERTVAEAMFSGDYERALDACDALANAHPETPRYGVMARVLRAKAARTRR